MKLKKLSCSNPKFKTLEFEEGLNIIVGLQLTKEQKKTINGVGKSLSLKILHHILGASFHDAKDKKLKSFLLTYGRFYLELTHNGKSVLIEKDFSDPSFYIDGNKVSQKDYPQELKNIFVNKDSKLSFKQGFNCFSRRYGGVYYTDALTQQGRPLEDYFQRYVNLYLLGIDVQLVENRHCIMSELEDLEKTKKIIKGYGEKVDSSNLKDITDDLEALKKSKENFIIAENYTVLVDNANKLSHENESLRNDIFHIDELIAIKTKELLACDGIDVDFDEIESVYNEASFFFVDKVIKRIEDAQKFHSQLILNRKDRLNNDLEELHSKKNLAKLFLSKNSAEINKMFKELNGKGALSELEFINERIRSLEKEKDNIEQYANMLSDIKKKEAELHIKNSEITRDAIDYLESERDNFERVENLFRSFVKRFYDNHGGSLRISETGKAKYLYNINIDIPRDGSQAINEVKIFCYDMLLFSLNPDYTHCVMHDGCIFSGMDSRQKSMIFKIVLELYDSLGLQYFVNLGENTLNEIMTDQGLPNPILSNDEKKKIKDGLILELYDKDPTNWLMGVSFG